MKFLDGLTSKISDVATLFVASMMLVTIVDIISKNLFNRPIGGTFELVELSLVFAVFLGIPDIFRKDANIVVDVLDHMLAPRPVLGLKLFGAGVTLIFLALLGWAVIAPAKDTISYPQYTQEAGIPHALFWLPILLGIALSIVCTVSWVAQQVGRSGPESRPDDE
jgi:TRAP-type C4-dicarboxylate transport system permease small subunit